MATPTYLSQAGEPTTPAEQAGHECVGFVHHDGLINWGFQGPAGPITVGPNARMRTNDAEHLRAAVLSTAGICQAATWLYGPEIASGEVKEILGGFATHPFPVHEVCPGGRRVPSRVRVFIDFLAEVCQAEPHLRVK